MIIRTFVKLAALVVVAALVGCAASPTERNFGQAVRQTMAQQRVAPPPAPDVEPSGDAERIENVLSTYRRMIGDPRRVVNEMDAAQGQGSR